MKRMVLLVVVIVVNSNAFIPCLSRRRALRGGYALHITRLLKMAKQDYEPKNRKGKRRLGNSYRVLERRSPEYQRALDFFESNNRGLATEEASLILNDALSTREQVHLIQELERKNRYECILYLIEKQTSVKQQVIEAALVGLNGNSLYHEQMFKLCQQHGITSLSSGTCTFLFDQVSNATEAVSLMHELKQYGMHTSIQVWNAAIHACKTDWQMAVNLFRECKRNGVTPNERTYRQVMKACAKSGPVRITLSLLEELQSRENIEVSPAILGTALGSCAKTGTREDAISILIQMQIQKVPINIIHVSALLSTCARDGRDDIALELLECFRQEKPFYLSEYNLTIPSAPLDLLAINIVLAACAKARNYGDAREILEQIKAGHYAGIESPDVFSYNTLLSACADPVQAKAIVKEMRMSRRHRYGAVPPTSITYTHAISACRRNSDIESALFFLELARNDGVAPNVYMYSAAIWCCGCDGDKALELLEEMRTSGCTPNVVSYNGVLSALSLQGRSEEALSLFEELKDDNLKPIRLTFQKLASAIRGSTEDIARSEMLEHVLALMNRDEVRVRTGGPILQALIRQYGAGGRYIEARRVFDQIQGPVDAHCLRAMLYACSAGEPPRWQDALSLLHTSDIVEGTRGPAKVDSKALNYAILACAKADEWEEALNLLKLYGRPDTNSRNAIQIPTFGALLKACGRCGQPAVALRLFNDMESAFGLSPDEDCYRAVVIACNQAEHDKQRRLRLGRLTDDTEDAFLQWWECALSLLRRMKESGLKADPQIYSSVISACEAAGQWQRALGVLRSMLKTKDKVEDEYSLLNLYCFNAAISACAKGGAWVEALELYYRMIEKGGAVSPNFITLSSLLVALDEAGQKELAQSTYEEGVRDGIVMPWKMARSKDGGQIRAMDLHCFSAAMAKASIRSVIESLLSSKPDHGMNEDLMIIVGKGKGSEEKQVLLPAVQSLLEREYGIIGEIDAGNAGRFIVSSKALKAYVDKHEWHE